MNTPDPYLAAEADRLRAEAAVLLPAWRRTQRRRRAGIILGFLERHPAALGVWENLARVPDRTAFWLAVAREAGPGQLPNGQWADLDLGLRRLRYRWLRALLRQNLHTSAPPNNHPEQNITHAPH